MSTARWLLHRCHPNDFVSFSFWNDRFTSPARSITAKAVYPFFYESSAPEPNRIYAHLEPFCNPIIRPAVRRQKHDMCPPNASKCTRWRSHDPLQTPSLFFRQDYRHRSPHNHYPLRRNIIIITHNYGGLH